MTQLATPPPSSADQDASVERIIQCVKLSKVFKDFWLRNRVTAVNSIDLDVRRGEVFGLLGPNGSGKSTTIKMILGLLHPSSGIISVFGRPPRDVETKRQIGYLPEESYLYRFLNARETLDYYGKLFHQDRRKRQARIDMLLEMVGLDKVQRRPIGEYSKGMQRRIGLAQALINDPQLLILDEPTTGLDPIGTRQIKDLILQLKKAGKTVLLCSHLLSDVEDVTDRAAIMFGGKVRRSGTIDELLAKHDQTTITAAAVTGISDEDIIALLESRGIHDVRVEQSRQKLESLFLDIVHQAQTEGVSTAGAGNAGQVASFLTEAEERSAHMPEDSDTSHVIDDLVADKPVTPPPVAAAPAKPAAPSATDDVLSNLTEGPKPTAKPQAKPAESTPPSATAQPDADQGLLDDLIGGDK